MANFSVCSAVGSKATVAGALLDFCTRTGADELMIASQIYDHQARLRSFEMLAELHAETAPADEALIRA